MAAALGAIADAVEEGRAEGRHIDDLIVQLRRSRKRIFGPRVLEGSARGRLRAYLCSHVGEFVEGEELAEVAGIMAWARRIRELREEGLEITERRGAYRLERLP
jgi:biotin operon repressor